MAYSFCFLHCLIFSLVALQLSCYLLGPANHATCVNVLHRIERILGAKRSRPRTGTVITPVRDRTDALTVHTGNSHRVIFSPPRKSNTRLPYVASRGLRGDGDLDTNIPCHRVGFSFQTDSCCIRARFDIIDITLNDLGVRSTIRALGVRTRTGSSTLTRVDEGTRIGTAFECIRNLLYCTQNRP